MRALVLEEPGQEPQLAVRDLPEPELGPHDALVRVAACGVCYHDVLVMRGVLRRGVKPRIVLGHEIAGRVEKVGPLVTAVAVGDPVASILTNACGICDRCRTGREHRCRNGQGIGHSIDGGFAEYVKVRETSLAVLPPDLDLTRACILGCPMGVALQALADVGRLQAGESVLVTGAGGGLGVHLVQLAKALGARVFAVTTSPQKVERLEGLGADQVLLAEDLDFGDLARALTEDEGVDVAVNTVGPKVFAACLASLAQFGRMVILGDVTGGSVNLVPAELLFRDAVIAGSSGTSRQNLLKVAGLVHTGQVRPIVSQTFALQEAAEAYRLMLDKESFGRLVLAP
jgi:D-arabinose 1-dehydrogenase-like Zn-dependent alcohol dehydrogenase